MHQDLLQRCAEALAKARRGTDVRADVLELSGSVSRLPSDPGEAFAYVVAWKVLPDDPEVMAAYAPHLQAAIDADELAARVDGLQGGTPPLAG